MKFVSFCLYGNDPKYCTGAIKNASLVHELYGSSWTPIFYVADNVPADVCRAISRNGGLVVQPQATGKLGKHPKFWRFCTTDANVRMESINLVRDTDSRITLREVQAVGEWLQSGKTLHVMRDHPFHKKPILAGMFGMRFARGNNKIDMVHEVLSWAPKVVNPELDDERFLAEIVWPRLGIHDCLIHDEYPRPQELLSLEPSRPFPSPRRGFRFVGEVMTPDDRPAHLHETLQVTPGQQIRLFTTHFLDSSPERNAEYLKCLDINSKLPGVRMYVLSEAPEAIPQELRERITVLPAPRPTFTALFESMRGLNAPEDVFVLANSDIYFDQSFKQVHRIHAQECWALSRHDVDAQGRASLFNRADSQDVWIFRGAPIQELVGEFFMGISGCDNRLMHELRKFYHVRNPGADIKALHLHLTEKRNRGSEVVPQPYAFEGPKNLNRYTRVDFS